jgi:hypothetical protein
VLSCSEVAAVLSRVLRREITFHPITFEDQKQAMINAGLPGTVAEDHAKALTLFTDGDADYITNDVPSLLGRPGASNSSPPTTPRRSREAQAAVGIQAQHAALRRPRP